MYCYACGSQIPDSAKFCDKCGASMAEALEDDAQDVARKDSPTGQTAVGALPHMADAPASQTDSKSSSPARPQAPDGDWQVRPTATAAPEEVVTPKKKSLPVKAILACAVVVLVVVGVFVADYLEAHREVKVTLDGNGGIVIGAEQMITHPKDVVSLPQAEREGYALQGWTRSDDGRLLTADESTFQDDVLLTAQWEIDNDYALDHLALEKHMFTGDDGAVEMLVLVTNKGVADIEISLAPTLYDAAGNTLQHMSLTKGITGTTNGANLDFSSSDTITIPCIAPGETYPVDWRSNGSGIGEESDGRAAIADFSCDPTVLGEAKFSSAQSLISVEELSRGDGKMELKLTNHGDEDAKNVAVTCLGYYRGDLISVESLGIGGASGIIEDLKAGRTTTVTLESEAHGNDVKDFIECKLYVYSLP